MIDQWKTNVTAKPIRFRTWREKK